MDSWGGILHKSAFQAFDNSLKDLIFGGIMLSNCLAFSIAFSSSREAFQSNMQQPSVFWFFCSVLPPPVLAPSILYYVREPVSVLLHVCRYREINWTKDMPPPPFPFLLKQRWGGIVMLHVPWNPPLRPCSPNSLDSRVYWGKWSHYIRRMQPFISSAHEWQWLGSALMQEFCSVRLRE